MQVQHPVTVRKDTSAWKAQVWISFGAAATFAWQDREAGAAQPTSTARSW